MAQLVDISKLTPHPMNLEIYGAEPIDASFLEDIKRNGILDPIVITSKHVIISGHRRWRYAKELGFKKVPCEIHDFASEEETKLAILSYNKNRIKTFEQEMKERDREIEIRESLGKPTDSNTMVDALNSSKGTYHRKTFLWDAAKNGNEKAKKLVEQLKTDDRLTPSKAYKDLVQYNRAEKIKKEREEASNLGAVLKDSEMLYLGDFKEVLDFIPDDTVAAIITDPPYPIDFIDCFEELGKFANKKLRPGGWLVTYSGQRNLPEVFARLQKSGLKYYWTMALYHNGTRQDVWGVDLNVMWKPVIIYCKPYLEKDHLPIKIDNRGNDDYVISDKREKFGHDWQQSKSGIAKFVETFTEEGDLIVDPFAGSGTTILISTSMGRKCIGAEIMAKTYSWAKRNILKGEIIEEKEFEKFEQEE